MFYVTKKQENELKNELYFQIVGLIVKFRTFSQKLYIIETMFKCTENQQDVKKGNAKHWKAFRRNLGMKKQSCAKKKIKGRRYLFVLFYVEKYLRHREPMKKTKDVK